jgi:DNA-binding SARP family transcriptional activator
MADREGVTLSRRLLDVTGSILTTLLVFGATPAVLLVVVGDPLGDGLGHQWSTGMRLLLAALAVVAWVAWAMCCTQLVRAVVEQVRSGHVGAPTGAVLTDRVAARIAAGVLTLLAFGAPLTLSAGAGAAGPRGVVAITMEATTASPAASPLPSTAASAPATTSGSYVVLPGDSLWSIAATQLGDGDDWPAIAALNLGRTMADGLQFVDPNSIRAGWTLEMPDQGATVSPDADVVVPVAAPLAAASAPTPPSAVPSVPATDLARPWLPDTPHSDTPHSDTPHSDQLVVKPFESESLVLPHPASLEAAGPAHLDLPELAALGIGALACAALIRRARRIRLTRQVSAEDSGPGFSLSPEASDAGILLARGAGLPALRAFEAANYGLAALLPAESQSTVGVRAICVGAAGVDFWLAETGRPAPDGLTLSPDGNVWHAAHGIFSAVQADYPLLPIVLPVGEDDDGTWLVPLGPGTCLPLLGVDAPALWRAARPVQEAWSWADMVLVTEDPLLASAEAMVHGQRDDPGIGTPQILYFGDPAMLHDAAAQRVSIVTLAPAPASDVTVLADRHGASIHPLGRTVRPHLMGQTTSRLIRELVELPIPAHAPEPTAASSTGEGTPGVDAHSPEHDLRRPPVVETYSVAQPVPDTGTVDVRLLTPTPRLEGLRTALPPNRVRRAVEVVAYLALHAGEEITSDRLRGRVLGSTDADAAAKTLFNIATAARRAMGSDQSGAPLFPPGTRTGLYRVSEGVTSDVQRATSLAQAGSSTEDPETAMGLLRAALSLVEGEPMANVLSGYDWWNFEGHGARISAVLVNAATDLAALAVEAEFFELAQWGLERARLLEPYSEAISRAAMQVAAANGDADRLRREWRDCQRRSDELDAGNTPSARTEQLYGALTRRVLVGVHTADR